MKTKYLVPTALFVIFSFSFFPAPVLAEKTPPENIIIEEIDPSHPVIAQRYTLTIGKWSNRRQMLVESGVAPAATINLIENTHLLPDSTTLTRTVEVYLLQFSDGSPSQIAEKLAIYGLVPASLEHLLALNQSKYRPASIVWAFGSSFEDGWNRYYPNIDMTRPGEKLAFSDCYFGIKHYQRVLAIRQK